MAGTAPRPTQPAPGAGTRWAPGPPRPRLRGDAVHVWRADLEHAPEELGALLDGEESARARRLLGERDRRSWTSARGVLRELLGRYLRRQPASVRLCTGPHGKPELANGTLTFNLSHSGTLALFAFTESGPVGVDVEVDRRPLDELALATRTFGAREADRLAHLDPPLRRREFLRAWTRHEAALKCHGGGFAASEGPAQGGDRPRGGDRGQGAGPADPVDPAGHGLWIAELDIGAGAAAAVALERPVQVLKLFDWRPARPAGRAGGDL